MHEEVAVTVVVDLRHRHTEGMTITPPLLTRHGMVRRKEYTGIVTKNGRIRRVAVASVIDTRKLVGRQIGDLSLVYMMRT